MRQWEKRRLLRTDRLIHRVGNDPCRSPDQRADLLLTVHTLTKRRRKQLFFCLQRAEYPDRTAVAKLHGVCQRLAHNGFPDETDPGTILLRTFIRNAPGLFLLSRENLPVLFPLSHGNLSRLFRRCLPAFFLFLPVSDPVFPVFLCLFHTGKQPVGKWFHRHSDHIRCAKPFTKYFCGRQSGRRNHHIDVCFSRPGDLLRFASHGKGTDDIITVFLKKSIHGGKGSIYGKIKGRHAQKVHGPPGWQSCFHHVLCHGGKGHPHTLHVGVHAICRKIKSRDTGFPLNDLPDRIKICADHHRDW